MGTPPSDYEKLKMPGYAVAIDHLVNGYLNPKLVKEFGDKNKIYVGTKNYSPEEISQEAFEVLQQIAIGTTGDGKKVPKDAKSYAQFIVSLDKEELLRAFSTDPVGPQVSKPQENDPILQSLGIQK